MVTKSRRRSGFSLMEILIALSIMAVLVAVVYPSISSKARDARTATIAQTTLGLAQGIAEFKRATTMYPSNLTQLTTAPVAGTDVNICGSGNTFGTTQAALWRGPYISRVITTNGVVASDAIINAGLRRLAVGSSTWIIMDITGVQTTVADDLESQFDGSPANSATGTIQTTTLSIASTTTSAFVPAVTNSTQINLSYYIPINSC